MELATDVLGVSVVAIVIGAVLAFFGYTVLRFAISLYGALIGFMLGGGFVSNLVGEGFLASAATWTGAIVGALLLGVLAFAFYRAAVVVGLALMGYAIGAAVVHLFWRDSGPEWLVVLVGAILGVLFAILAVAGDFPGVLIIVVSAVAGAEIAVSGVLVLIGEVTLEQIAAEGADISIELSPLWLWITVGVAVAGMITQFSSWGLKRRRERIAQQAVPAG